VKREGVGGCGLTHIDKILWPMCACCLEIEIYNSFELHCTMAVLSCSTMYMQRHACQTIESRDLDMLRYWPGMLTAESMSEFFTIPLDV
jgi:hypothetical protein